MSERLGHSSISVTFDIYGHLMPGMDEEVAERLDEAWQRVDNDKARAMRAPSEVTVLPMERTNPL